MEKQILHIDVNNAFLSWTAVDMLKNGSKIDIREIPAIIGGDETRRAGIVLAKSQKAKEFGIQTAQTIYMAKAKCPSLKIYPSDYKIYKKVLYLRFESSGFLRYMIRNIVGLLLDINDSKKSICDIEDIFKLENRTALGRCASPVGLYLNKIEY